MSNKDGVIHIERGLFEEMNEERNHLGVSWTAYQRMLFHKPEPIYIEDEQVEVIAEYTAEKVVERLEQSQSGSGPSE